MFDLVSKWYLHFHSDKEFVDVLTVVTLLAALIFISMFANYLCKKVIDIYVKKFVQQSKFAWDNVIYEKHVFTRLSHLVPIIIIGTGSNLILPQKEYEWLLGKIDDFASLYLTLAIALVIHSLLSAAVEIYKTYEVSRVRPINSYVQVLKIILWILAFLVTISILLGEDLWGLFLGLGGMMAIILLVFKDSILGLVAGVQIAANDLLRVGDWLEMPSRSADGDVMEISLNTVKVRNWDQTITTIPTHVLVTESFKNWRGMSESGGRRIKRDISIDMGSVEFCSEEMLDSFKNIQLLEGYLLHKQKEIEAYNEDEGVDTSCPVNGRRITNLGTFRAYLVEYLEKHPKIHKDMTFLVRQLPSGPTGLPIEIYVFSNDQAWANYEAIQADIFDHILAILPTFGLKVFQKPSGSDFAKLFK